MRRVLLGLLLSGALGLAPIGLAKDKQVRPEFQPIQDVEGLPRVLIIGDSISIGYTLAFREALRGVANVHRPPENCASTLEGLEKLDQWLGDGKWDVIHFNWGLHDLKHINEKGELVPPSEGRRKVPLEQYAKNLDILVGRLKETGAALIWRLTTPVPKGANGRIPGDELRYNLAALEVMKKYQVRVQDLNVFMQREAIPHVKPDNVHFSEESSEKLAQQAAKMVLEALKNPAPGEFDRVHHAAPDIGDRIEVTEGLVYAKYGARELRLDLYLPKEPVARPIPVVIVIHGGGFRQGHIKMFAAHAAYLANHGFAAASIEYRLTPEAQSLTEIVNDVKAAVRWVRANAEEYGLDPGKIGAIGGSAGGYLVNALATMHLIDELEGDGGNPGTSSRIQAAVALAGSGDLTSPARMKRRGMDLETATLLSPVKQAHAGAAPSLFIHCEDDATVPYAASEQMVEALEAVGVAAKLIRIRDCRHPFWKYDYGFTQAMEPAVEFFMANLK